jgi:ribosome-binding ATPase
VECAIVGLPFVGKTTVFNLLTGAHAATGTFVGTEAQANVGVAKVPDQRLERVAGLFAPKKTTHAEIRYSDVGLTQGAGRGEGIAGKHLAELRSADALAHMVRGFRDPSVPHVSDSIDPARDAATLELELLVADLGVLDRRLERLRQELRAARPGEREEKEREAALVERLRDALARGTPVRDLSLEPEELRIIRGFRLLSEKPQLVIVNLDEADVARSDALAAEVRVSLGEHRATSVTTLCAKLEAEVTELPLDEREPFRRELGLREPPLERIVRETYALLGLISFFTANEEEARAWTVPTGTTALEAAGTIHTDMQRGFIRAEVARWDELVSAGGLTEARSRGVLRQEGKSYVVQDGDLLRILFNV